MSTSSGHDLTGIMPPIRPLRTLSFVLRSNPTSFRLSGEDTPEWAATTSAFRAAWLRVHGCEYPSDDTTYVISSVVNGRTHTQCVLLTEVTFIEETVN